MRNRIGFRARMPICAVILAAILFSFPSLASAETGGLPDQPSAENTAQGSVDAMTDDAAESNAEPTSPLNAGAIEDASVTEVQKQNSWTQAGSCEWGVDDAGCLILRPASGASVGVLDYAQAPSWSNCGATSFRVEGAVRISCSGLFSGCSDLIKIDLSGADFSSATDVSSMFYGCDSLEEIDWGGSSAPSAQNAADMFSGCSSLKSIDLSFFSGSRLRAIDRMFSGCLDLKNIDLSCLDASELESISDLFGNCEMLKAVDLRSLDLSLVQEFGSLFSGCKSLQSAWFPEGIVSAKNMAYMFSGCSSLSSLDLSSFDTSRVRDMAYMFSGCSSLSSLDLSSFDTSRVSDASDMFSDCDSLSSLDISSFDTSRMSSMDDMFGYYSSIKELKLGSGFSVNGAGDSPLCTLPTSNAHYREILWKNQDGTVFEASEIPPNIAGTYKSVIRITDDDVRIDYVGNGYVYTGSEVMPVIDTNLVEGVDYYFACSNNINSGMASVEIVGIGEYAGQLHLEYEINKAMPDVTAPSEVAGKFGQRLAEVALPRGWTWDNPDYVVNLDATGWQYGQTATFYPDDLNNYWTVSAVIPIHVDGSGSWQHDSRGWWWQSSDGSYPVACWDLINGSSYYFDARGYMLSGWQCVGGSWYWLGVDGAMKTGWQHIGGSWYWLADSGAMATGWTLVGDSWYYLSGSGAMLSGWQCVGGSWYWLGVDGAMKTGFVDVTGNSYHFADSGAMSIGWFRDLGDWYFADSSGALLKSCWVGNYYLKEDGRMATDQWVGEYYVRDDGSWDPNARKDVA